MSEVRVRNLEPWVVDMLRDQARRAGCSLEGYLREHLRDEALRPRREWAATLKARQDEFRQKYALLTEFGTPVDLGLLPQHRQVLNAFRHH